MPSDRAARRWAWAALALSVAAVAAARVLPGAPLALLTFAGAALVLALAARAGSDRWLTVTALAGFGVSLSVAVGLYGLSYSLASSALPWVVRPGFWTFSGDAAFYHQVGRQIATSLAHQVPFPQLDLTYGNNFHIIVGLMYWLLGSHPLTVAVLNAAWVGATAVLAYRLIAPLGGRRAARISAIFVAGWPSAFVWSSQLMKDTFSNGLMVVALVLVLPLISPGRAPRAGLRMAGLGVVMFLLFFLREYLALGLTAAAAATVVLLAARRQLRGRALGRAAAVVGLMAASIVGVQRAGPDAFVRLLNPKPSATNAFRLGLFHEARGEREAAIGAYRDALALKTNFTPAYLNLGMLLARRGDLAEARWALERFVALNPGDYSADSLREIVRLLGAAIEKGVPASSVASALDSGLEQGRRVETIIAAAEASVSGDPSSLVWTSEEAYAASPEALVRRLESTTAWLNRMTGRWMVEPLVRDGDGGPEARSRFITNQMSVETMGMLRRGFVVTGGSSLLTDAVPSQTRWYQFVGWIPSGVAAVLFSPYPWHWRDAEGRLVLFRVFAGLESLLVLLLLPAACAGAWCLVRSRRPEGVLLIWLFVVLAVGVGTTVVNAGTLFRLRLPVLVPFLLMAGMGMSRLRRGGFRLRAPRLPGPVLPAGGR